MLVKPVAEVVKFAETLYFDRVVVEKLILCFKFIVWHLLILPLTIQPRLIFPIGARLHSNVIVAEVREIAYFDVIMTVV